MKLFCFFDLHRYRFVSFHRDPTYQLVRCKVCGAEEKRYNVMSWVTK